MEHEHLIQGNYYHIFNRGNNSCNLFEQPAEYEHFLWLYDKYISPVADTFAWALMRNHFHLLVYIKTDVVYKYSIETLNRISPDKIWYEEHKWETIDADLSASAGPDNVIKPINADRACPDLSGSKDAVRLKKPVPHRHFSHLFNAYSRYLQTRNGRTGNLFERPFKRKQVDSEEYLKRAILYIHNNPVHHRFCTHPLEYPWSSYLSCVSGMPTKLKRVEVLKLFNNKENFKLQHNQEIDIAPIEKWLEIAPSDLHEYDLSNPDANKACPDWSGSGDAVRSGGNFDLSACEAPDNVEKVETDNVINEIMSLY
jgi:putative transposase